MCRHGLCGPICSFHPWDKWIPPDLHGFYKSVSDDLGLLNNFTKQVVVSRRDSGILKWTGWLREDLGVRPYAWLRARFCSSFSISCRQGPSDPVFSDFGLNLISLMLSSARLGCLFFCRSGHPVVSPDQFLDFVGHLLPQEPHLDLPRNMDRDLQEVARAKKSTAGGSAWVGVE